MRTEVSRFAAGEGVSSQLGKMSGPIPSNILFMVNSSVLFDCDFLITQFGHCQVAECSDFFFATADIFGFVQTPEQFFDKFANVNFFFHLKPPADAALLWPVKPFLHTMNCSISAVDCVL
jgi:hypothetical protein